MAQNILGLMDYVQQQGEKGRQQGQQQSFNRLAGQAYTAPAAQQGALVGQMVGIDPKAGMEVGTQLQTNETDHMKKLGGAARYMAAALQSKNPAQIEGAYQAVRPYLTELSAASGKVPPPQWDPSMEPAVYQAVAQTGGDNATGMPTGFREFEMTAKAAGLQPGTPEYQQAARIALGSEGRASSAGIGFQKVTGADGRERIGRSNPRTGAFEVYNEQTGQFEPMGGPQGQPQPQAQTPQAAPEQLMAQATQMANQGGPGANAAQAEAWLQQQLQATGRQPQPSNPGLAVSRSPEETAAATEDAKQRVSLQYLPQTEAIKASADVSKSNAIAAPELAAKQQKAQQAKEESVSAMNDSIGRIDDLLRDPAFSTVGTFGGDIVGQIPHTVAKDVRAKLDTISARSVIDVLSSLKSLSTNGSSGFGALSEKEGEILRNAAANLNPGQSNAAIQKNLLELKSKLARSRDLISAQEIKFPEDNAGQPATQPASQGGWAIQRVN